VEQSLLQYLIDQDIEISHSCGGMGTCGTCRVIVTAGLDKIGDRNEVEQEMATERGFEKTERLACQNAWHPQLRIQIPEKKII
jgi:2Fe-2S ferredoxin